MLTRAAAVLESNLGWVTQEWVAIRAGAPEPPAGDVSNTIQGLLASMVHAMREQQAPVTQDLEQQAKELGLRYREQGYELRVLVSEYALLRDVLWQLYRRNLRSGDLSVVELAGYLEGMIDGVLLSAVVAYTEAYAAALAQEAAVDSLTRVYTRGYLMERLTEELERGQRYQHPFTILLVDVDGLKAINDTFGHQAGDEALQRVAGLLHAASRKADIVGRYGGDEFIVTLPETPARGALFLANRLVRQVVEARIPTSQDRQFLSISIGLATYPEGGTQVEGLVAAADRALYEAKARGGNGVALRHPDGTLEVVHIALPLEGAPPTTPPPAPGVALQTQPTALLARWEELEQSMTEMNRAMERLAERLSVFNGLKETVVELARLRATSPQPETPEADEETRRLYQTVEEERRRMRARLEELRTYTLELQRQMEELREGLFPLPAPVPGPAGPD